MLWHANMDLLRRSFGLGILIGCFGTLGCGDSAESASLDFPPGLGGSDGDGNAGDNGDGDGSGGPGAGAEDDGPPAEVEERLNLNAPRAGLTSVYVPNPLTHRVAVVNAETFGIEAIASGTAPTFTATVPGKDVALVINVGSGDLTLLRTLKGKTQAKRLPLGHSANVIAISPNGKHAVVYLDSRQAGTWATSFQDVTVVDLTEGAEAARGVSVGFRPTSVAFSEDAKQAFVVTEDGISVVDLTAAASGPTIAKLVSLGDALSDALSVDVEVSPDGRYAFARRPGEPSIRRIDLQSGAITELSLEALQAVVPPSSSALLSAGPLDLSDMDLVPDGSALLAVERQRGALLRIPIPEGFDDPSKVTLTLVEGQVVGSVSIAKSGKVAVLYTTISGVEGVTVVDLEDPTATPRGVRLRKSVRAVALSDEGDRAFVLHSKVGTAAGDEEARIDASEGYSLVDTTTGFAKLQLTPVAVSVNELVMVEDSRMLFALLRRDAQSVRALHVVDLDSFEVSARTLARPPSSIGVVPANDSVFVGHESVGGMITFFHGDSGEVSKAVSGFELASRIRQ